MLSIVSPIETWMTSAVRLIAHSIFQTSRSLLFDVAEVRRLMLLTFVIAFTASMSDQSTQGVADDLIVTRGQPAISQLNDETRAQQLMYGLGQVFQIGPRTAAASCNIRTIGTEHWDFENGTDFVVFDDLKTFSQQKRLAVARNEQDKNPATGKQRIAVTYPIQVGFVPLGAKRPDGTVQANGGTGFGFSQALCYDLNEEGYYTPADAKEGGQEPSIHLWYVHQLSYDGRELQSTKRVRHSPKDPLKTVNGSWSLIAPGMSAAIPDGEDLLLPVLANDGKRDAAGVSRWRHENGEWRPVQFYDVSSGMEPSLIRDVDMTLLYSVRGSDDDSQGVRVWRSGDNGNSWKQTLHDPTLRSNAPVVLNQAADGAPFVSANQPGSFRAKLCAWPLNTDRSSCGSAIMVRDCVHDFGDAPSGTVWFADHPMTTNVRLADGLWHCLFSYRVIAFNTTGVGGETITPQTGCYIEEVRSSGTARPAWQF